MAPRRKPRLYHDVDGVLFASYTVFPGARPVFQLRPYTRDWFRWVLKRFELVWLTTWNASDLESLLSTRSGLYLDHVWQASRYLDWQTDLTLPVATKAEAVKKDLVGFDGPWFWIDDFPEGLPIGFPKESIVYVPESGPNGLIELVERLPARLRRWSS